LCRYVARPPICQDRLELTADGRPLRLSARVEEVSVPAESTQIPLSLDAEVTEPEAIAKHPARHARAWLLQRVFVVMMTCPRCRGAMRLVKIADKPDDIARVLADLGVGARPPPRPRPAPAGQLKLDFAA
jgi:hypothetical protein